MLQSISSKVLVYPIIKGANSVLPKLVLSKTNTTALPIQGHITSYDPSCIYTATRIFLKNFYNLEFKNTLDVISEAGSHWALDETFRQWLGRFVDSDFYDDDEHHTYSFIVQIDENEAIDKSKFIEVSEEEYKLYDSVESRTYFQIRDYYEKARKENSFKYFAVLNCEVSTAWRNHYEALYIGIFKQKGEIWKNYAISESHLPTDEDLSKFKGIVVSGANHAAYDDMPFHDQLFKTLQKASGNYQQLRLLGVCFGCQVLAHSLGGRASKMQTLNVPFIGALSYVQILPELKEKPYFKKTIEQLGVSDIEHKFVVVEAHGDHVEKLPENATLLAHSETTNVEMWALNDKVLAVQFHPEFTGTLLRYKVIEEANFEKESKDLMVNAYEESEKNHKLDRTFQINLCKNFLKS